MRTSRWALAPGVSSLLTLLGVILPQSSGPVALLAVVAPYWYALLLLALLPLAVVRRDAVLAALLAGSTILAAVAYQAPPAVPRIGADPQVRLMTWNLHGEDPRSIGLPAALARWNPDVIVLEEAAPQAIPLLPEGMHVLHRPDAATPPGMIIATRFAVTGSGEVMASASAWDRPRAFWLTLEVSGQAFTLVGVHLSFPMPADSLPCPYCPDRRDAQVRLLGEFAATRQAFGERVVLAGDFNLTDRESAYANLRFLTDADRDLTWRPIAAAWMPPVLRLDYVLAGQGIAVVESSTDCPVSASDHCPLNVELGFALERLSLADR